MKRASIFLMLAATVVLSIPLEIMARGGGRGGGGGMRGGGGGGMRSGGGGMSRPSPSVGRTPSMSGSRPAARPSPSPRPGTGTRPSTRPSAGTTPRPGGASPRPGGPGAATRPGGRPTAGQINDFLDVPSGARGPSVGGGARPGAGGAAADFLQRPQAGQLPSGPGSSRPGIAERPGAPGAPRPGVESPIAGRPGARAGIAAAAGAAGGAAAAGRLANNRPDRIENRQQWQDNRQQRRGEVWDQVQENHPRLDFWTDHPNWAAWRINRPYRWATWAAITGWVGYGWGEASTFSYGDNVYYSDDQVYYGDQPVATADEYAQQAETIAQSAPETPPADSEWLPLGVFAATQDGQASGSEPTLFMQLAISKQGVISGTFKNMTTGQVQTLEGMADKASQRVAWCVVGTKYPIVETGISNLTQDTAPILVHFADGQTQQWLLVRLPEPKEGNAAPSP